MSAALFCLLDTLIHEISYPNGVFRQPPPLSVRFVCGVPWWNNVTPSSRSSCLIRIEIAGSVAYLLRRLSQTNVLSWVIFILCTC